MNAEDGMFTDRGYIAYKGYYQHGGSNERQPEQPHGDGRAFTMILYLTHGNGEESIPLKLPASSSQVDEIDIRLDDICSGEGNFRISDVKSSVKGLWQFIRSADLLDPEDLEKLNRLSRQIDAMSEKEHQIFAGALLSECISNLDDVLQTVGRIGQYGMIPEVTCDRELGWYLVEHGKIDCPEHLKPYLDYVGIGAEFYSNCGGAYTLDGYVVRKEHLSNHSQVPEPWRNENRDEMLRMTLRVDGKPDYTLVLPADEEYLDAVKAYLDIDVFADAMLCDIRFKVPYIGELIRDTDCPAVEDYNDFAEALEDIWQQDGDAPDLRRRAGGRASRIRCAEPVNSCEIWTTISASRRVPTVTVSSDCRKRWGWMMKPSMSWTATWILRNTVRTAWKTTA